MNAEEQAACHILSDAQDTDKASAAEEVAQRAPADVDAERLLELLSPLPYAARISAISRWASRCAQSGPAGREAVAKTIAKLTATQTPAELFELESEPSWRPKTEPDGKMDGEDDDWGGIFPDQQTSMHSSYDRQQLGLFAAAAAGDTKAIAESADGPSRMMKKLSLREVARAMDAGSADPQCNPERVLTALPVDRWVPRATNNPQH